MAFVTKEWKDRLVEFAGRRKLKNVTTGAETVFDVSRSEGAVSQAGDAFSAANMNNLEQRIKNEFDTVNGSLQAVNNKINNNIYAIKQNLPGATLQPYKSYSTVATVQDINGYTPIFAIPANSGNADLAWTRCEITSGYSLNIGLFNVHENAQTTSRITVIIAYKISE